MVLIWGWGNQYKKIADVGIMKCRNCNNFSTFEIRELAKNFKLYFVPVAKWGRKYYLVCNVCEGAYELEKEKMDKFLSEISNMPDNQTSLDIWNKIDTLFAELVKIGDMRDWDINIEKKLIKHDYRKEEVEYVLSFYTQYILESLNGYKEIENTTREIKKIPENKYIFCPYCRAELPLDARYCKKCGKKIL